MADVQAPAALDSLGLWQATLDLPEQMKAAKSLTAGLSGLPAHHDIENVVVLGMGGSGVVGDLLAAVAQPFMAVPLVVVKGYQPPNFVSETTLCLVLSFSGNTEETVEAATEAAAAGARLVVLSSGGRLAELAQQWHAPHVALPTDIPMPRVALGAMAVPALQVLEQVGLFPGAELWIDLAITQLRNRRRALEGPASPAAALARRIGRTMALLYGDDSIGAVAAQRWKTQITENAKAPAFASVVPELMHNEICGWGQHGDVTRQVFTLVLLRHDQEHPQVVRRYDLIREWTDEAVASIEEVRAEGEGTLAQLLDLIYVGDVTSLHLAFDAGVDPGPVPVLDQIKSALADR